MLRHIMAIFLVGSVLSSKATEQCAFLGAVLSGVASVSSTYLRARLSPQRQQSHLLQSVTSASSWMSIGFGLIILRHQAKSAANAYMDPDMTIQEKNNMYKKCAGKACQGVYSCAIGTLCLLASANLQDKESALRN